MSGLICLPLWAWPLGWHSRLQILRMAAVAAAVAAVAVVIVAVKSQQVWVLQQQQQRQHWVRRVAVVPVQPTLRRQQQQQKQKQDHQQGPEMSCSRCKEWLAGSASVLGGGSRSATHLLKQLRGQLGSHMQVLAAAAAAVMVGVGAACSRGTGCASG